MKVLENKDAFRETFKSKVIMYLFEDAKNKNREDICCLMAVMRTQEISIQQFVRNLIKNKLIYSVKKSDKVKKEIFERN